MRRATLSGTVLFALAISTLTASLAGAQSPPPPTGYAVVGPDTVLEPLLVAAEADLGRGEAALALARATAVVGAVPPDGPAHVRAQGLVLLAQQRLGTTPATEIAADVALAPLVDAAAADGPAGRIELARARLDFVLARVSAASDLATRATATRAALDARTQVVTTAPVTTTTYQPIYGGGAVAPTYVYTQPGAVPTPQEPPPPSDPHRRGNGEIVELYVTGGLWGGFIGAWIPYGAGLLNGTPSEERSRATTIGVFAGAGVLALGVFALDELSGGLRTGVPAGISMGIRYGLGFGALSLGIVGARQSVSLDMAFNVMGAASVGGALLGAVLTMTLEPHPSQVQFTQTSGLWGALFGAQLAMIAAPLMDPSNSAARQEAGFGLTLGGLSAGLLTGIIMSAMHANPSARRSWHMTLGFLAGSGAGTALWALISAASSSFDVPTLGGCMLVGSIGGLVISGLLSSGDTERANWDDPDPAPQVPTYQVTIAPTQGGGTIGMVGTF